MMEFESSPLSLSPAPSSQQISQHALHAQNPPQRQTRQLPFELAQHVRIYFEESMFGQAFRLLSSIVSADLSSTSKEIITAPPTTFLALTATVAVHPAFTTRTNSDEKKEQANAALRLLRIVGRGIGVQNSGFKEAFDFVPYDLRNLQKNSAEEEADEERQINSIYSNEESLWACVDDFWAVVGWAMNCACLPGMYSARWECWSLWLEFMVDSLESDWATVFTGENWSATLLWQYVNHSEGSGIYARRILRAIFADGSGSSLNEFREVFRKELRKPKENDEKLQRAEAKIDIEADIFGDYHVAQDESDLSSDDDQVGTRPPRRKRLRTVAHKQSNQPNQADLAEDLPSPTGTMGSTHSLVLRLRLLNLLSKLSAAISKTSLSTTSTSKQYNFPDLDDLATLYVEFIKPLSLSTFQQVMASCLCQPRPPPLDDDVFLILLENLLQRSLESSAPCLHSITPLQQSKLQEEYLPYAASKGTTDSNCRVSLLLEALLRKMADKHLLDFSDELMTSIEDGIGKRMGRVGQEMDKKNRRKGEQQATWEWMVESGERMRAVARNLAEELHRISEKDICR